MTTRAPAVLKMQMANSNLDVDEYDDNDKNHSDDGDTDVSDDCDDGDDNDEPQRKMVQQ